MAVTSFFPGSGKWAEGFNLNPKWHRCCCNPNNNVVPAGGKATSTSPGSSSPPAAGAQLTAGMVFTCAGWFAVNQQHSALPLPFCVRRMPGYYPDFPAGLGMGAGPGSPHSLSLRPLATAESQPGPSRPPARFFRADNLQPDSCC